jgi:hypothetical protein
MSGGGWGKFTAGDGGWRPEARQGPDDNPFRGEDRAVSYRQASVSSIGRPEPRMTADGLTAVLMLVAFAVLVFLIVRTDKGGG